MSRPIFASTLLVFAAAPASAQDPMRPWLDWRTITTPNYRFHFPRELESWTRAVAEHVESIDSAIVSLVGYAPPRPVYIVVDDPFSIPNGYALPFLDRPATVWWAVPADPRTDIGNYRSWGEMLAVHELTHIAHMTRPSRNPFQRFLWGVLPANLGPIARKAPRWVFEGYATVIEGRITGSGRPNNVWRPAVLRQWAIEGSLPTYVQLSSWGDFNGGDFAYLGGSAFLEWLTRREGDSTLVHVWRRLTARRARTFDASFAGVYGDAPALLYGKHTAELTRDAMAAKSVLERAGIVEGELVQRLSWWTGDPAVSPNGERIAISLSERERPRRVVVWQTAAEPLDTAEARRRVEAMKRDPMDVPDRRFYPRTKKAMKTLFASNGRSFQQPRWFADNRRVLVTRWAVRGDGTEAPDLYIWNTESGGVRRATRGAGLTNGDPHPDGREAVATQCRAGRCGVARVDLASGAVATLLEGDPQRSYYRPRYSPDGTRFVASVSDSGRWRVVVANRDGSGARYVDPGDGANRYDAQWLKGSDTVVVVSERGGIPNLELVSISTAATRSLTRVTGAAVAPEVDPTDGSIWFLALHSRGFDVRHLKRGAAPADSVVVIAADRFGFAGLQRAAGVDLPAKPLSPARSYGAGPRHQRWLPGGYASADGAGAFVTVFSGDIVGRLNAALTGAYGKNGTWRGGSLRIAWRFPRPTLELGVQGFMHRPSLGRDPQPSADSLDASLLDGVLAFLGERQGEGWRWRARLGGAGGTLAPRLGASYFRGFGFGELELQLLQSRGSRGALERLRIHTSQGHTRAPFQRTVGRFQFVTTGRDAIPLELGVTLGKVTGNPHPFELFSLGGATSPVGDSATLSQRYAMPMFPTGIAVGNSLLAWRVALPDVWTIFYEGAATGTDTYSFRHWNRAIGFDTRFALPPVPAAFAPRLQSRAGVAYTLDPPFRKKIRAFVEMKIEP